MNVHPASGPGPAPRIMDSHHPLAPTDGGDYGVTFDSESCKNTPFPARKSDAHQRAFRLLSGGTQSAQSSPLPHRRLDKLEGVIRDKPGIRFGEPGGAQDSPLVSRKFFKEQQTCNCPSGSRADQPFFSPVTPRRGQTNGSRVDLDSQLGTPLRYRRRVDSDTSRQAAPHSPMGHNNMTKSDYSASDMALLPGRMRDDFLFSDQQHSMPQSPIRSVLGEPGVFASPARSVLSAPAPQTMERTGWKTTMMKEARPLVKLEDRHRRRLERWHAATDKADV